MTADLDAPLGTAGSLVLDELMSVQWRHRPEPRRSARLLVADLPTGRLELSCNDEVTDVVATLDGEPVAALTEKALREQGIMFDGASGPGVELGKRRGTLTWRMRGSKLRPLGRQRWFQVELGDRSYSYFIDDLHHPLTRSSDPDGERCVVIGTRSTTLASKRGTDVPVEDQDTTRHSLNWFPTTTTAELVLAELLTMGMDTMSLRSLPAKLLLGSVDAD